MTKEEIINGDCVKHVKVYKLNQMGFKNKEIADLLSTNQGHVWNVLKRYKEDPNLINIADNLII